MIRESEVEAYLVKRVRELGGIAYKFTSPNRRNVPDRLVLMPNGRSVLLEVKRPGHRPTSGQARELTRINALGHRATWVNSFESVDFELECVAKP